jgi:hypothetical protein
VVEAVNIDDIFWLPLSDEPMLELEDLQEILQGIQFDEDSNDIWRPVWGNDYSAKKFYDHIYSMVEGNPIFKIICKSRCIPRVKFFFWLILVDRLNTKNMLSRRHIGERSDDFCVLCTAGTEETIEHLFFQCPFACQCWDRIGFHLDLNLDVTDMILHARRASNLKFFTEIVLLAAWELWKVRNDRVFNRRDHSLDIWFANFRFQCIAQSIRFKVDLRSAFCAWLDAIS